MRSITRDEISHLSPIIKKPSASTNDVLLEVIKSFPDQIVNAMKQFPTPVIAPRSPGSWVIDVHRDSEGKMSQMIANFHETTK